ncbi:MAG: DUF3352 domain-containing protein [Bacteroidales bacterium]|nr:DUF3352 domain-containing protein [Bacteroidales bacterium]NLK82274.1 DUF3352 domain-containing protein [Bacteroidales bacterium]HPY81997.1 DUF3352 domain-containing protein [Bacteroidales bacterium]
MQKKILTSIIILCLLGIILFTYIFLKKESQSYTNAAFEAVPQNTAIIFDIKKISDFSAKTSSDNEIWNAVSAFDMVSKYNSLVANIDSICKKQPSFVQLLHNNLVVAMVQIGKNKLEFLFVVPLQTEEQNNSARAFMRAFFNDDTLTQYMYNDNMPVFSFVTPHEKKPVVTYSIAKQTLIISASRVLVEEALKNLFSENTLLNDESFASVQRTASSNTLGNVYINLEKIASVAYLHAHTDKKDALLQFSDLGSWCEFDINVYSNYLLLNGFSSITNPSHYFTIFQKQTPVPFEIKEVLPAGTSSFIALGIRDKKTFAQRYESYLKRTNRFQNYQTKLHAINTQLSLPNSDAVDIKNIIYSIIDNEIAMVYGNVNSLDIFQNTFAVIKVQNQSQAREKLLGIIDGYCDKNKLNINDFTSDFKIDEKIQYKIYTFPVPKVPYALWGDVFFNTSAEYICFIENYVVFGNSVQSLSKFIHAYELKKTLEKDIDFSRFSEKLLSNYTWYLYSNVSKTYDIYPSFLDQSVSKTLQAQSDNLKKFEGFAIQVNAEHETFYNHLVINYNPGAVDKPRTVWESYLDTVIISKPKIIDNFHTGEKSILVQDAYNNLYMLNKSGVIQWKRQLKEPIMGEIHEVDFYKNNKIQYVCNTKNYIYMIDRIGNFVERYPIKLESEATAGMSVFDYENNREYRIFIPCANKRVYLYSKEGNTVKDWAFGRTESIVTTPVQYFRLHGKDYIVFADQNMMYMLNRRGDIRVPVTQAINKSPNNVFVFEEKSNGLHTLVTTNRQGEVVYIDFKGNVSKRSITKVSENHFFEYKDMNADGKMDYVFLDKNKLNVYSQDKKEILSYTFEADITTPISLYNFSRGVYKIGVVDNVNSKIYLINGNGTLHEGFPLKGKTMFSIGFLYPDSPLFNLVIGGDQYFLYNYEVK